MEYIKLFETCRLVKGFKRSAIYDLDLRTFFYIPNALYDIFYKNDNILKTDFYNDFSYNEQDTLKEYIDYLLYNRVIFYCNESDISCFTKLNITYQENAVITNAIIYLNENSNMLNKILDNLEYLLCKDILFIVTVLDIEKLYLLSTLTMERNISSITLYVPYFESEDIEWFISFLKNNKRIKKIVLYSAPETEIVYSNEAQMQEIIKVDYSAKTCFRCSKQEEDIGINRYLYNESLSFNSCLNRKITIDTNGNIKNCPNMKHVYGNIRDKTLLEFVECKSFISLWHITKDKIDVCKDCEYRYACEDCRYHIKDKDNIYSQPSKCNYNPYIAKWKDEDGYVPVEECGTYSRETGFIPDKRKIAKLNKLLWAE